MLFDFEALRRENMNRYGFGPETMQRQKVCKACGTVNEVEKKYCTDCGSALPSATLFDLYRLLHPSCPSCHAIVSTSYRYCPSCGKLLKQSRVP